jgi:hypothetical protein
MGDGHTIPEAISEAKEYRKDLPCPAELEALESRIAGAALQ